MTTGQIMMKLREIEAELDRINIRLSRISTQHLENAQSTLCELIATMLADEQRARAAHTMADLPYDGQRGGRTLNEKGQV